MKRLLLPSSVALFASCATYYDVKNAAHLHLASRVLSDSTLQEAGTDTAIAYGVDGVLGLNDSGLGLEGAVFRAEDDGEEFSLDTWEYSLGLRLSWFTDDLVQPYVGAGATYLTAEATLPAGEESEQFWGAYAHTGVGFDLGLFELGLDLRFVTTEQVATVDLSYFHASVFAGVSF